MKRRKGGGLFPDRKWWDDPLEIDLYNLDYELWRQSKLVTRAGRHVAKARNAVNEAKARMELVEAELKLAITKDPAKFGLDSKTIPIVEAAVTAHPKYQRAVAKYNATRYELDVAQAMADGMDNKKTALQGELSLFLSSYFAEPKGAGRREGEEYAKRVARRPLR